MTDKTLPEILRDTKARIEDPSNWGKHTLARDRHGCRVDIDDPTAFCFCLEGAMALAIDPEVRAQRAYTLVEESDAAKLLAAIITSEVRMPAGPLGHALSGFNDSHATHPEMMALLDEATLWAEGAQA